MGNPFKSLFKRKESTPAVQYNGPLTPIVDIPFEVKPMPLINPVKQAKVDEQKRKIQDKLDEQERKQREKEQKRLDKEAKKRESKSFFRSRSTPLASESKATITLPGELIPLIISFVTDQSTLRELTLVNKCLNEIATPILYRDIKLLSAQSIGWFCLYMAEVNPEKHEKYIKSIELKFDLRTWDVNLFELRNVSPSLDKKPWIWSLFEPPNNLEKLIVTTSGPQRIGYNEMKETGYRIDLYDLVNDWLEIFVSYYGPKKFNGKHLDENDNERYSSWTGGCLFNLMSKWISLQELYLPIVPHETSNHGLHVLLPEIKVPYRRLSLIEIHSWNFDQFGTNGAQLERWLDSLAKNNNVDKVKNKETKIKKLQDEGKVYDEAEDEASQNDFRVFMQIRNPTESSTITKVQEWIDATDLRKKWFKTANQGRILGIGEFEDAA
ncbi:uncharacterized protein L201_007957 [Kwoniella dendrophila CBS 6074]|uniref:F-box domain-containing protein n=1 Tax=Kwoniella dendrophila CBS 6074 TaxID=1295534 RepID=A0AAX4K765_9TREE